MAVTITQSPQSLTPSDNPVNWVFQSDQTTQNGFYFLIEVYIANPSVFVLVENHKVFVQYGIKSNFDAKAIAERYAIVNNVVLTQVLPKIRIKVIEKWSGSTGASATSSDVMLWKCKLSKSNFVNYQSSSYYLNTVNGVKFLTNKPRGKARVKPKDLFFLSLINNGTTILYTCKTYQANGTIIDTATINVPANNLSTLSCGVNTLESDYSLDFTGATYYTIEASNGTAVTEIYRIDLDTTCQFSTRSRIHFLNTLGGIDSYTFGLMTREKTNIESFGYERQFGGFNDSGVYSFDLKDGTVIDYLKKFNKELELTSDWMNESIQHWLHNELYTSPIVYIENEFDLYRCKLTNTSSEKKIQENDMLLQEVVKIELESDTSVNV